jgi:hypothetical protein
MSFLDPILASIFNVKFRSIFVNFGTDFGASIFTPLFDHFTGGRSPGSKLLKIWHFWTPEMRFLLYSSVYDFRSERSALRPPKKW